MLGMLVVETHATHGAHIYIKSCFVRMAGVSATKGLSNHKSTLPGGRRKQQCTGQWGGRHLSA